MTIWQIILIICGAITAIAFIIALIGLLLDDKKFKDREWWMLLAMLIVIPIVIIGGLMELLEYLSEVWKDGGFRKHYQLIKERKAEYEAEQKRKQEEKVEYNIKRTAYLNGLLTRDELPRLDGVLITMQRFVKLCMSKMNIVSLLIVSLSDIKTCAFTICTNSCIFPISVRS